MLSRPRNPPSKVLLPSRSFRFTHQVKLRSSLWKERSSQSKSPCPRCPFESVGEDSRPCMYRRVDIAEVPFVGRQLAVGMEISLTENHIELLLAEVGVDHGQRQDMKGEVPRRVPRVFPLIRH